MRLVLNMVCGMAIFGAGLLGGSNWYEYRLAVTTSEIREMVNTQGWEIVPDQANPSYLRRAWLRLH